MNKIDVFKIGICKQFCEILNICESHLNYYIDNIDVDYPNNREWLDKQFAIQGCAYWRIYEILSCSENLDDDDGDWNELIDFINVNAREIGDCLYLDIIYEDEDVKNVDENVVDNRDKLSEFIEEIEKRLNSYENNK